MTSTSNANVSTTQGACVFCNTERPIDQVLCPACGRGWIDTSAADSADSVARAEAEAIRRLSTDSSTPRRRLSFRKSWWIPVAVAAAVFALYWAAVTIADGDDPVSTPSPTLPTTLAPTTTSPIAVPPTTLPPVTTTTATPVTTTTVAPTTTTLPPLPSGEPIPLEDLQLGAVELGDIAFGSAADDVIPRLVGTFGQPTSITETSVAWGTCEDDTGQIITFGGLSIITVDGTDGAVFAGYSVEESGTASDALQTFSGVAVGATVAEMSDTYRSFTITAGDSGAVWTVASVNDGRTLLTGTATGTADDATVDRIASPRPCDGGPAA